MNFVKRHAEKIVGIGVAAALVLAVAGCGSSNGSASNTGKTGSGGMKTLNWYGLAGTATWANTLDPAMVTDSISYNVLGMVNGNLVKLVPSGQVVPDLASGWKVSNGGKVYTFTLRPNLKFANGDKITAQDEQFSILRALNKKTASPVAAAYLGHIVGATAYNAGKAKGVSGMKVLNSKTIQFTLDSPIAFFLKTLTYPTADVLDPKVVQGKKPQTYLTDTCAANVGDGPFKFQCRNNSTSLNSFFAPGSTHSMTLVPNKNYYGAKPHIKVYMPVIADTQTNYKDFQSGNVAGTAIPTLDIAASRGKPGFYTYPTSVVDYITPNESVAPFNNVHCRLALAYGINRDVINNDILHHSQKSTYSVVPQGMLGYSAGANNPHYNVAKAKAEAKQCPGGIQNVTMTYQATSSDVTNEYNAITHMWQKEGIGVKINGLPFNTWLGIVGKSMQATATKLTENLWIEDYPDPYDYCTLLLRAGQNYDIGGFNDPQYNKIVDQAAVTQNQTQRANLYVKAQHIALMQGAWITVGNQVGYALVNPKVHGFVGSEAFGILIPKNNDWSNISIS